MEREEKVCMITGMRSKSLRCFSEDEKSCLLNARLKDVICHLIREHNVGKFISGLAPGIEILSAELVIDMRKSSPDLQLECVEAYEYQGYYHHRRQIDLARYKNVMAECDKRTVLFERYQLDCESAHRKYMVDSSDYIVAVWDRLPGDHIGIVPYALTQKRSIIRLNPRSMVITWPKEWSELY